MMRPAFLTILAAAVVCPLAEGAQQSFNARDFSGYWHRKSRLVTFSNVPTGPNDTNNAEPPFTTEGKKRFDANKPGYGPRVKMERNDPIGRCEPMGLIRNLNAE